MSPNRSTVSSKRFQVNWLADVAGGAELSRAALDVAAG